MIERRNWSRDDLLVALKVYCELEFGQFHQHQARIIEVAAYLQRTPSSLAMKLCNFASLDPAMMGKGLKGASKADATIMEEFLHDTGKVVLESEKVYTDFFTQKNPARFSNPNVTLNHNFENITQTEKISEVKTRTVQHFFRTVVISSYHFKCAVCKLGLQELLIASHIIPWSKSEQFRTNPANGISLCALHDRAFDRGFFTFGSDYAIILSGKVTTVKGLPVEHMFLRFSKKPLNLPFRFLPNKEYLKWHRDNVFLG